MKKINISEFVLNLRNELDDYETYQTTYSTTIEKTMDEWVESFMNFSGYLEETEEEFEEEYDDEVYYGQDLGFEDLVNRKKYRSFRDDDMY